jgi:hypothetical protein
MSIADARGSNLLRIVRWNCAGESDLLGRALRCPCHLTLIRSRRRQHHSIDDVISGGLGLEGGRRLGGECEFQAGSVRRTTVGDLGGLGKRRGRPQPVADTREEQKRGKQHEVVASHGLEMRDKRSQTNEPVEHFHPFEG